MRIAVVMDDGIVNSAYRAVLPFRALAQRGHDVRWDGKRRDRYDLELLMSCDLVYVHRHYDRPTQRMAQAVRDAGVALWWDNDDDIRALPRGAPNSDQVGGLRGERIFAGMVRMMRMADLVSTPSRVLAETYGELGIGDVAVIDNYVPLAFVGGRRVAHAGAVTIGWIAALEHRLDADQLELAAALERVCVRRPRVRVVTVGVRLALRTGPAYRHVLSVPFDHLGRTAAGFDIGIAPIADNRFNRARSSIKVKEYAAAGTPWLASPVGPYRNLGVREGGILVEDGDWDAALLRLVDRRWLRRRLARRAARWGRSQTIEANAWRWEAAAEAALSRARRRTASRARTPAST